LVVTAIVTGVLMAERIAHFIGLQAAVSRLETKIQMFGLALLAGEAWAIVGADTGGIWG
jgi:hypothetical protein